MSIRSNVLTSGTSAILHSLIVPVFALVFVAFYRPYGIYDVLQMPDVTFTFNLTILFCIVLVSVSIVRLWLFLLGKYRYLSRSVYAVWCLGEIVVSTMFVSLYMTLVSEHPSPFFDTVGLSFVVMLSICVYPYGFLWLGLELYAVNQDEPPLKEDTSLIRFYDEYHKLRFVIAPEAVVYVKSEENYVQIHYMDQNRMKKFILRSSMKALDETMSKHGLIRCHRSYFVNPSFIKIVHRDSSGLIVAELRLENSCSIPVSRKYHDVIIKLI